MAGKPSVEGVERFAGLQNRADRQQVLDHIRADRRGPARACRRRRRRNKLADRIRRRALEFARPRPRDRRMFRRLAIRASAASKSRACVGRAVADQPLPDRQQRGAADLARPHAENCRRPETVPAGGTAAAPDRRCAAALVLIGSAHDLAQLLEHEGRRPWRLRRARWRARTPASAAPATAAEAARDNLSAARSMSGSCARNARLCCADGKARPPSIIKAPALRSR